jgi:hypothetical protein
MTDVAPRVSDPAAGVPPPAARHPTDPDLVRSTKAAAVLALGVAAVVTGPLVGGIVPATIGLLLAQEARKDLVASRGYLINVRQLNLGRLLAWVGIGLAVASLITASVIGLISLVDGAAAYDFPDSAD